MKMPDSPIFLRLEDVLSIHQHQLDQYGGQGGQPDKHALDAAINMPKQMCGGIYLHPTLTDMAAAYFFHITQDHPFIDGNKRTGATACIVFLNFNGFKIKLTNEELYQLSVEIAKGQKEKSQIAEILQRAIIPLSSDIQEEPPEDSPFLSI